ncbi:hypothetical protein AMEX_G19072 [Astyanax mexicanus]|uniref:Uncharacterized protein n=1 Tax=Astyanax mexicanus TaxID=7994 RepID=A0A8T2L8V7_ASTMX|nr:hypothetical protein AMEX_G19072 [Astyanax mexicanus]
METAAEETCHSPSISQSSVSQSSGSAAALRRPRRSPGSACTPGFTYLQCCDLTLGVMFTGLPVTIARAGLVPFLVSFLTGFFMQALLIYLFVDLLQRCRAALKESVTSVETERILMQDVSLEESSAPDTEEAEEGEEEEAEDVEEADAGLLQKDAAVLKLQEELQPNLHVLGTLFLSKRCSRAFDLILLSQFVSIGISYVLAGSEAYAALLHTSHIYVIPVFTWTLSLGILLAQVIIQPITSLLTLLKGILLIITVAVTFVVGSEVRQETTNDFTQIGKPFLMGTVALGGIINVMPFLFSEISHNKTQVMWFRRAVLGGLATCTVLNVLWCWAVLEIVPQMAVESVLEERPLNTSAVRIETTPPTHTFIYSNISLEK